MQTLKLVTLCMMAFILSRCNSSSKQAQPGAERPNIITIYVDDMGIGDVSYAGGKVVETPNIDRLARNGKIFTQYYTTAPVCSPSRVGITTGMYHIRWNINTFLNNREFNAHCGQSDFLDKKAPTIARSLKAAGYQTAHFGKWHMGGGRDVDNAPSITEYGFDEFSSTWESPDPDPLLTSTDWIWAPSDSIKRWERTDYFVNKTLDFLSRNIDQPCFVNLWPDDVHTPWVGSAEAQQEDKESYDSREHFVPVLVEFDRQIGRLIKGLSDLGISDNTLIIFTSDNGPAPSFQRERTIGLRGLKNSLYEGGILMPFIACWPGQIEAGQVDSTSIIASIDIFPTLCQLTGAKLPATYQLDGEDFSKAMLGQASYDRQGDLFFEYGRNGHYNYPKDTIERSPQLSIRHGDWKLFTTPTGEVTELYNLAADPTESKNLSATDLEIVDELKSKLIAWYHTHDQEFAGNKSQI